METTASIGRLRRHSTPMQIAIDKIEHLPDRPAYDTKKRAWARRGRPGRMPVILAQEGSFFLLSGFCNVRDAEQSGATRVECKVRKNVDQEERDELRLSDEYFSSLLPPMKMAEAFISFRKKYGISQQELARRTRITAGTIHHYESLLKTLAPALRKHVDNGELTFKEARGIADIDGHERQFEMAQPFIDGTLSSVYVEDLVSRAKSDADATVAQLVVEAIGEPEPEEADEEPESMAAAADPLQERGPGVGVNGAVSELDVLQESAFRLAGRLEGLSGSEVPEYRRLRMISTLRILQARVESALGQLNGGQARRDHRARPMRASAAGRERELSGRGAMATAR